MLEWKTIIGHAMVGAEVLAPVSIFGRTQSEPSVLFEPKKNELSVLKYQISSVVKGRILATRSSRCGPTTHRVSAFSFEAQVVHLMHLTDVLVHIEFLLIHSAD